LTGNPSRFCLLAHFGRVFSASAAARGAPLNERVRGQDRGQYGSVYEAYGYGVDPSSLREGLQPSFHTPLVQGASAFRGGISQCSAASLIRTHPLSPEAMCPCGHLMPSVFSEGPSFEGLGFEFSADLQLWPHPTSRVGSHWMHPPALAASLTTRHRSQRIDSARSPRPVAREIQADKPCPHCGDGP